MPSYLRQLGASTSRVRLFAISAVLAVTVIAVIWASINTPGPTGYVELDLNANVGFDFTPLASFDWANSGANTGNCAADPSDGNKIKCGGTGGIFDGGKFNGATTPPTPPTLTAAAAADPHIVAASFGVDPLSVDVTQCGVGDPTAYTGVGGETNGDILNSETFGTASVPNKDEISNVYAIAHQDPIGVQTLGPNDTNEIFAGFERVVNNGDSHVDLEFLQSAVTLVAGSKASAFPCAGRFSGHRTSGDLLLSVDFTNGGTVGNPVLHKWACATPQPTGTVCDPAKNGATAHYELVTDAATQAAVTQRFNSNSAVGCGGWACRNADGTQATSINTVELYEVGIDLASLGFNGCISTFLPHTRSSQSFTATLKDFEVISFNTCNPSTVLTKSADVSQVTIGGTINYTYTELNDGQVALSNPSVVDNKCSPVTKVSDNGNNDGVLDVGETWTFKCTTTNAQPDAGSNPPSISNVAIGHGTFNSPTGPRDVTWCSDPSSPPSATACDQDERATLTIPVKIPSTILNKTATPSVQTTVTYTYTETNDGTVSLSPPVAGNLASFVNDDTCTSIAYTGGDGNGNGKLDPAEVFTFSCQTVYNGIGTHTNVAKGHGIDNLNRDVTVCPSSYGNTCFSDPDETDTNTVTISVTVNNGK